tara:strand:+ start:2923 stop:3444 length:522 start_codon:yes stop_codon:yes gene_type:complete
MINKVLITHMHDHGFGFGCVWNADNRPEQCFIPAPIALNQNLNAGDTISVIISPNFADKSESTPWQVVKLLPAEDQVEPAPQPELTVKQAIDTVTQARDDLDDAVLSFISSGGYATSAEIASAAGVDQKTALNSAQRHFNANRIARAAVFHRADQTRPSFILYAPSASDFVGE